MKGTTKTTVKPVNNKPNLDIKRHKKETHYVYKAQD